MSRKAGASSEAVVQPSDEDSNNFESTMRQRCLSQRRLKVTTSATVSPKSREILSSVRSMETLTCMPTVCYQTSRSTRADLAQTILFVHIFQYKIVQSQDNDSRGSYQEEAMSRKAGASSEAVVQPSDEDSNNFESTMRQICLSQRRLKVTMYVAATVSPKSREILSSVTSMETLTCMPKVCYRTSRSTKWSQFTWRVYR